MFVTAIWRKFAINFGPGRVTRGREDVRTPLAPPPELLMKAGPGGSSSGTLFRLEIPPRAEKMGALTYAYERWTGLCPVAANEKWRKKYGLIRFPQLELRETNNVPIYWADNVDDLKPILELNMAKPFLSTFLSPPGAPRGKSSLGFPADDSRNNFMAERSTTLAPLRSIFDLFLMDAGLPRQPGIIDLAQPPPATVTEAAKEFRDAITEEHSIFLLLRAKARPAPGVPTDVRDREGNGARPLPHCAAMEYFFEDELFERQIGYPSFSDGYLKFCARRNSVGSKRASRPASIWKPQKAFLFFSTESDSGLSRLGPTREGERSPSSRFPQRNAT